MKRIFLLSFLLLCGCFGLRAANPAGDRILGVYEVIGETTHERSKVRIYANGDTYEARIIWLEHPNDANGKRRLDTHNPDPALRTKPADQIVLIRGLRYDAKEGQWNGGTIYDPVSGKTYDMLAEFEQPDVLHVRGYVGRPVFGKSFSWKKPE